MCELKMFTVDEVADLTGARRETLAMWREVGILNPIKTGRNYMYSQEEIKRFQIEYAGWDISNKLNCIVAFNNRFKKQIKTEDGFKYEKR